MLKNASRDGCTYVRKLRICTKEERNDEDEEQEESTNYNFLFVVLVVASFHVYIEWGNTQTHTNIFAHTYCSTPL